MLPRGLFDRTCSVYLQKSDIRMYNSTKLKNINSIRPASFEETERKKKAVPYGTVLQATFMIQTGS